jgi:hypothetical protein
MHWIRRFWGRNKIKKERKEKKFPNTTKVFKHYQSNNKQSQACNNLTCDLQE